MKNGTLAQITTNWLTPFKVRYIEIATATKFIKGWFIEKKATEYSQYKKDGSYISKELPIPFSEPLMIELKSFIRSIQKNEEVPVTAYDGLKALEIAHKCLAVNK
jgi:predicted dehydrogenase